jgi:UDP-N-acetylglucosamine 1-carboxyvinyltransferase
MGAVLAEGETILSNAAREPEIDDLINFLNQRGAKIEGIGTSTIKIQGVGNLTPVQSPYQIIPDRIEALTYIVAAIMTNSSVKVTNCIPAHFESVIQLFKTAWGPI